MNTTTAGEIVAKLETLRGKIRAAEEANRSASTLNRLWREFFRAEDALRAYQGPADSGWAR